MNNSSLVLLRVIGLGLGAFFTYRLFTQDVLTKSDRLVFVFFTLIALYLTLKRPPAKH